MQRSLRKEVVTAGRLYWHPDGPIPVSHELASSWQHEFKRMSADGLVIPVCVEHHDSVTPCTSGDKILKKQSVVGRLDELSIDDDGLIYFGWTPNKGVIGKRQLPNLASPYFQTAKWTDVTGKERGPAVLHLALTNVPTNAGQSGKWEIVDRGDPAAMSLAGKWKKSPAKTMAFGNDDESDETPDEEETPTITGVGLAKDDEEEKVQAMLQHLAQCEGPIVLPSDTTKENLVDRLLTAAIQNCAASQAKQEEEANEPEVTDTREYEEEPSTYGTGVAAMSLTQDETKLVDSLKTRGYSITAPALPASKQEVEKLVDDKLKAVRMSPGDVYAQNFARKELGRRLNGLVRSGRATPAEGEERMASVNAYKLSLNPQGEQQTTELDWWITEREKLPAGTFWPAEERAQRMGLEEDDVNPVFSEEGMDTETVLENVRAMGWGGRNAHKNAK